MAEDDDYLMDYAGDDAGQDAGADEPQSDDESADSGSDEGAGASSADADNSPPPDGYGGGDMLGLHAPDLQDNTLLSPRARGMSVGSRAADASGGDLGSTLGGIASSAMGQSSGAAAEVTQDGAADASPSARDQLVEAQDLARANPRFRADPRPRHGPTYCNLALYDIVSRLGGPTEDLADLSGRKPVPYMANQIADNLAKSSAYRQVTAEEAQRIANGGGLTIFAWKNSGGHGHVGTVRPEGVSGDPADKRPGPLLNNIGRRDKVERSSSDMLGGPKYYAPR